ncbi:AAA family ATPase [Corynebacterium amycolatum]|uniref:AAA family ATPase n=1 Tax=Corynebacterium amycolatum TaxID=43765 RepID=A0AB37GA46_CORAY|nr:AAA family ATPase [Corynebacterium amycolatum]MCQ9127964.1 AAA family ATPase [Corynebacterium amycolatum]MCQ9141145.1 AAA family ATPase [Corynebacterium amycolatum]QPR30531.1 AAA family ATPase [Corynebacterium amycolatum]QQB82367.1 AAA family ATPase [Corynebacterium amycolatum]
MKTIAFFNNKGGVGKTTLACNIAAKISDKGYKTLFVDLDPQCNSTQLVLGDGSDELFEGFFESKNGGTHHTIYHLLEDLIAGDVILSQDTKPLSPENEKFPNRFGFDIIAGNPNMAMLENHLSNWWAISNDVGNIRKTNWFKLVVENYSNDYDFLVVDMGPSLGALNRSVMLNIDYFISPIGADIFSVMALRNIDKWIQQWRGDYIDQLKRIKKDYPRITRYSINSAGDAPKFIGFTKQQYITKSKKGVRRPTIAYEKILEKIPAEIENTLKKYSPDTLSVEDLSLGDIPTLYSLVPLAQTANSPIEKLKSSDGLNGAQFGQQTAYVKLINAIVSQLLANVEVA